MSFKVGDKVRVKHFGGETAYAPAGYVGVIQEIQHQYCVVDVHNAPPGNGAPGWFCVEDELEAWNG